MKKTFLIFLITLGSCRFEPDADVVVETRGVASEALYRELGLEGEVDLAAFDRAAEGFRRVAGRRKEILSFIDFTLPSTEKRLWVIDMARRRVLFNTWVAHGRESGELYATSFSNRRGSHKSSLGFYLTAETYIGRNGYSLMIDGLDAGLNDNARGRAVVVHGAWYADPRVIASMGRLGRSFGCPALPPDLARPIIDSIKGGSVLYIHGFVGR
ncbi:MAG: murein L,D-transpeptidase catalytic domain family protein [Alistipes sp.]|jgi:hypothetical protein|nr:murein L,D-transpeptidase catalytic domain family protein [Alistipes sp.]